MSRVAHHLSAVVASSIRPRRSPALTSLVLAATAGLAACGGGQGSPAAKGDGRGIAPKGAPVPVNVRPAQEASLERAVTVSGTLAAEDQVALGFKVAGRIETIAVDLGSRVQRGQTIARLAPVDFQLRVEQAEAALQQARARLGLDPKGASEEVDPDRTAVVRQARAVLDEAKLNYSRVKTFVDRGISSRAELDSADAALKVADGRYEDAVEEVRNRQALLTQRKTELDLARQQLSDSTLIAPFDGIIRERTVSPGQYVNAGAPIATLVRMHPLRLQADVPERDASSVKVGQAVKVRVEGDATSYEGRVVRVSPAIDEQSRSLRIEAEVGNQAGTIRPGSFATADIVIASASPAIVVPASAIVSFAGVEKVLTVADGKVVERRIELGRREGKAVEVLKGLTAGERVIVEPGNLVDGEAVKVNP
ncbi:RND transporter [Luteitalea sp. TBR-22]|uniref:efflux RND transporter periplasmic adaptor subunit n=1 Tax=Luteitalea sp. TBR-22 TaxID=2802971 RepID=UPI001AFAF55C|nr:efflux RND transporter periplasmic adaptor subunit [Luteitalea sp. TBR-22]BCS33144.1 RND transporter [Luteitalea sp. TBR-22]